MGSGRTLTLTFSVTGRPAVDAHIPLARYSKGLAVIDTGGDGHLDGLVDTNPTQSRYKPSIGSEMIFSLPEHLEQVRVEFDD